MKKSVIVSSIIAAATIILASSCASVPDVQPKIEEPEQIEQPKTPRKLNVVNSSITQQKEEETEESKYAKKIADIKLSVESSPKETTKGRAFSSPFVFKAAKSDGTPVEGLDLSITYPETRINGQESFALVSLTTNSSGTVTFIPATPSYSFDSKINAYPSGDLTNEKISELASKASVSADYKVKTNLSQAGGTISIVDFTSAGKPIVNNSVSSSNLLMTLMRIGFKRVGNADFSTAILTEDKDSVYKAAKSLLGSTSSYLIYGTVKYLTPVEVTADKKYTLTLEAKITCLDMKNGSILYETTQTSTVTEDKDWNCINSARKDIAEKLAVKINYGM